MTWGFVSLCHVHASMHAQKSYIHAYIHTYIHTYIYTCMHAYIHIYTHTYIHTYIHTHTHTHTYTHTHIHTYIQTQASFSSSKVVRVGTVRAGRQSLRVGAESSPPLLQTPTLDPAIVGDAPVQYLSRALEEQQKIIEHLLYQQQVSCPVSMCRCCCAQ